jgi:hypothetical protein
MSKGWAGIVSESESETEKALVAPTPPPSPVHTPESKLKLEVCEKSKNEKETLVLCKTCSTPFSMEQKEIEWYVAKNFQMPKNCARCRRERRQRRRLAKLRPEPAINCHKKDTLPVEVASDHA